MKTKKDRLQVSVNMGFITNSSSCVHWFPSKVLEHSDVKAVLDAYGAHGGWIGDDLWRRTHCDSFLVSDEQKQEAQEQADSAGYGSAPDLAGRPGDVVVVYGDEYDSLARLLSDVMSEACSAMGLEWGGQDYN